jgi:hypothetical protein
MLREREAGGDGARINGSSQDGFSERETLLETRPGVLRLYQYAHPICTASPFGDCPTNKDAEKQRRMRVR